MTELTITTVVYIAAVGYIACFWAAILLEYRDRKKKWEEARNKKILIE